MNAITSNQERCIHALHRQLGRDAPLNLTTWSKHDASRYIDELKRDLGEGSSAPPTSISRPHVENRPEQAPIASEQSRIRLGLASKLVFGRWNGDPLQTESVQQFKERAKRMYDILLELEQEVLGGEGR